MSGVAGRGYFGKSRDNRRLRKVSTPNNLPAQLSSFVGRERQLAELRRLLRKSRLITLTGPGGAGKTRLALRLAADVLDRHPDGVWLVELAAIGDARLLEQTVASACGIAEKPGRPMADVVVEGLAGHRVLLVLDGCEHLVDSCAALASRMLRGCPKLTLVATSRELLGVPGEITWRTPSLSVPGLNDAVLPELVMESEAVRLFVERARLSRPDFELDQTGSQAVAQICARLEGIPLAIELAASLARIMTLPEILDRLRDRFRLLTGGSRSALPRHQTLRQAVDWSYGLLSPHEQALFVRLAVFAGGFELSAAEAIVHGDPVEADEVLPLVSRLVDKSLLAAEPSGPAMTRYRMLDTIREYALERFQHSDQGETRRMHALHFVDFSVQASGTLGTLGNWMQRLDEEQANVRMALAWCLAHQSEDFIRLAAAMSSYWLMRSRFAEGLEWLDQALEMQTTNRDAIAAAFVGRARIRERLGEYREARRDAEQSAKISRQLGLKTTLSRALNMLGVISSVEGNLPDAERLYQEALMLAKQLDDRAWIALTSNNLALVTSRRGDDETAKALLEQALAAMRSERDDFGTGVILDSLGEVNLKMKAFDAARNHYAEATSIFAQFDDAMDVAACVEGLGLVALAEGDPARMIRLASAANGLRVARGGSPDADWMKSVEEGLAAARAMVSRQAADAASRQGAAFDMNEAITHATGTAARRVSDPGSPLTGREKQVAALIAEGLTNSQIAARLKMAARTADAHVEHIRNKLGLRTRSQIAVWAHERLPQA
jgi:predicted ATPase/DNA-binding CsgD family transcriptional regulator